MLTEHGVKRVEQRIGLSRKYTAEHIEHVLSAGWPMGFFKGGSSFKKYLNEKQRKHPTRTMLVYGHYVYVFSSDQYLITVLPIPTRFHQFLRERF